MSKNISRRDLLKGMAAGAASVATLGVLGGCAGDPQPSAAVTPSANPTPTPAPAAPAVYKAGTYTSAQTTSYATVEVKCTFSETALTDVSYEVKKTTKSDYFTPFASAMEDYCKKVAANGKTDGVDGVAGATLCTTALKDGVNACTAQALGLPLIASAQELNPQADDYKSFDGDCDAVFSPIKLGSMELPNRIIKAAGSGPWNDATGTNIATVSEQYGTMAENGVPLIIFQGGTIRSAGILPGKLRESPEPDLTVIKPYMDRIHAAGGKVGYQICYIGLAPSYPDTYINDSTIEDIDGFIEEMGISAQRGKAAGFDCIEIKGASNDALNGFLTRRVNRRTDEYGPQSIENRTRLFCRMIQKVKEVNGPDFPVGALINGVEENDVSLGNNDGFLTIEESKEIAKALVAAGADWIQVRVGVNGQEMNIWAPDVQHVVAGADGLSGYGTMIDYSSHFEGMVDGSRSGFASFLPIVKAIKEAVDVPVGCAAYMDLRVGPDYLNEAIKRGDLDLIFMNRPLNCDPELVTKIKEHRREDVIPCMKCMHCHDRIGSPLGTPSSCRMNATSFNSLTEKMPEGRIPTPAAVKKNVMVIGAGPAGLECARVAAERGHTVTIYDSADKIGGLLPFAQGVKGDHEHFEDYFTYISHQLEKNGVTVKLRTKVDAALVKEQKPDAVVVATGGVRESKFSGEGIFSPEDAFGSAKLGQNVVILGAGVQAVDFAAYLVTHGKKVTMVHDKEEKFIDLGQSGWFRTYILPYLYANGVKIWNQATVKSADGKSVTITTDPDVGGINKTIPCDSVVEFYDMVPNTGLAAELEKAGFEVHTVGDAAEPYNIQKAVLTGNLCARAL